MIMVSLKTRAERSIGQGTLTNSRHWKTFIQGVYPTHIKASTGAYLVDENNKKYLDFMCGLGTNILGYGHPIVENEVQKYRFQGKSPTLPHVIEIEAAEAMKSVFPWVHKWKFLKTGTEACLAAIRMARAKNGRSQVYSSGYHGWSDIFTSLTPPSHGVVDEHYIAPYDDSVNLENAAAVIVEPVVGDDSKERIVWLCNLKEKCRKAGAVLIFDEVITGLRYMNRSVSKCYGIEPDLIVVGKAIANGYPLAAVGGPKDILDGNYFVSSTYASEITSLAACKYVISTIKNPNYNLDHMWEQGAEFLEGFNAAAEHIDVKIEGYPTRGIFTGNELNMALLWQESCKAGILFGKSWFISHAHLKFLNDTLRTLKEIIQNIRMGTHKLQGHRPISPLSMRDRK
jgi:glutamate-1-semialdehyde aminotransferase